MLSLPDFKAKSIVVCFATEGQKVSFKNDNLIIKSTDDEVVLQATCHRIFSLWIVGPASVTSGILERSKKFGFSVFMLSYSHRLYGYWSSAVDGNFLLRQKQYTYDNWDIARHLVHNKISNQVLLLKSMRRKTDNVKSTISSLEFYKTQLPAAAYLKSILGIEGVATRMFFSEWYADMYWQGRRPRAKPDYINTILDIGYTYMFYMVECMLSLYGFDLYQGVYHRNFYQRKSLVCDLVEPFRCIIDKQVKRAHRLRQLQREDFYERNHQYYLKPEKNKEYTKWLVESILEHKEDIFKYIQAYYRCFIRQKPIEEYPVFYIK